MMPALRCCLALGMYALASQLLACDAEILSACIGGDLTCSSSTEGDTDCSCDGYQLRCEKDRSKDYTYKWRSLGQTCGPRAITTTDTPREGTLTTSMPAPAEPTLDPVAIMRMDEDLAPVFIRGRGYTLQQVIAYLNVVIDLPERLELPPTPALPLLEYQQPCDSTSALTGHECRAGVWMIDYEFKEFANSSDIMLQAKTSDQAQQLLLNLSKASNGARHYLGYQEEGGHRNSYEFDITCPGQGIRVSMNWGTLHVQNELIACPTE